ncbi:MAG: HEAT repeat domain-containing protein, partial [Coraliomargarita sp.]
MKIKHAFVFFAGLLIAGVASAVEQSQFNGKDFTRNDAEWIAVLESDADVAAKRAACRELAVTGTAAAVPPLAELLRDAKLSHMARFALEHIPGAAADAALIDALDDSEGEALAALIASIGVRRIDAADTALLEFLKHSDPAVVKAAANALGRLATDRSIQGLLSAWESAGSDQ